ncbi:cytosolic phospholipase A2 gamma [Rhinophrynus dorsalis]
MASGGGLRAMIGLLGYLSEMASEDLLDTVTYICGTSGSTWGLASLYERDNWSECMEETERRIGERLTKDVWNWESAWAKLIPGTREDFFSLTNVWAYMVVSMMTKDINETNLSSHQAACENGTNPYPVYSAVEKENVEKRHLYEPGTWFEFTPHRAGFPAYSSFVDIQLFGSQFMDGKVLKKNPEKGVCYLQGLWGSALARKEDMWDKLMEVIHKVLGKTTDDSTMEKKDVAENKCKDKKALAELKNNPVIVIRMAEKGGVVVILEASSYRSEDIHQLGDVDTYEILGYNPTGEYSIHLSRIIEIGVSRGVINHQEKAALIPQCPVVPNFNHLPKVNKSMISPSGRPIVSGIEEEEVSFMEYLNDNDLNLRFTYVVDHFKLTFLDLTLMGGSDGSRVVTVNYLACDAFKVYFQILNSILCWEWGKTHNFLYHWQGSGNVPSNLSNQPYIGLVDAGLEMNNAFPLMLPPHRKVDLFLCFEFTAGDPFMPLKQTAEYCEKHRIPFPKINIEHGEEESLTNSCYIFEGDEKEIPTVMHFPLFNRKNCGDNIQQWRDRFKTFRNAYDKSELDDLLQVSKLNVKMNREKILEKIQQAYERK